VIWNPVRLHSRAELKKLLEEQPMRLRAVRPSRAPRPGQTDFVGLMHPDKGQKDGAILYDAKERAFYFKLRP